MVVEWESQPRSTSHSSHTTYLTALIGTQPLNLQVSLSGLTRIVFNYTLANSDQTGLIAAKICFVVNANSCVLSCPKYGRIMLLHQIPTKINHKATRPEGSSMLPLRTFRLTFSSCRLAIFGPPEVRLVILVSHFVSRSFAITVGIYTPNTNQITCKLEDAESQSALAH